MKERRKDRSKQDQSIPWGEGASSRERFPHLRKLVETEGKHLKVSEKGEAADL